MPDTEIEAGLRHALARQKMFATSLLGFMGVLMLASYALPPGWGAALLEAASKAGFVGGIADWFAVTALFRHPLGLPIPHTAIIPREKDRLGRLWGGSSHHTCSPGPKCRTCWRGWMFRAFCTASCLTLHSRGLRPNRLREPCRGYSVPWRMGARSG